MGSSSSTLPGKGTPTDEVKNEVKIKIPGEYICPISKKIMSSPVLVISSGSTYDEISLKKWMNSGHFYDPSNGISMSIQPLQPLLYANTKLHQEITEFILKYPHFRSQMSDNSSNTDWESIFKTKEDKIFTKSEQLHNKHSELRKTSVQLLKKVDLDPNIYSFSNDEKENLPQLLLDTDIHWRGDIPFVSFTGPSRCGKSTLINDLIGVGNEYPTLHASSVTEGAWITLLSHSKLEKYPEHDNDNIPPGAMIDTEEGKQNINIINDSSVESLFTSSNIPEMYLIDMEGLNHGSTQFKKKLFYTGYALSNIFIWNDRSVASDLFRSMMAELKKEMAIISMTNDIQKPKFVYLLRDSNGFFDYKEHKTLDIFIKNHSSFQWLRDLNIFSSLHGYELNSRPSATVPFSKETMEDLKRFLFELCVGSNRFISSFIDLKTKLLKINHFGSFSVSEKITYAHKILSLFMFDDYNEAKKIQQMLTIAENNKWDAKLIEKKYFDNLLKYTETMKKLKITDNQIVDRLNKNYNEILERVKNKITYIFNTTSSLGPTNVEKEHNSNIVEHCNLREKFYFRYTM